MNIDGTWYNEVDHVIARNEAGECLNDSNSIAVCYGPKAKEHARLIAAAPELLSALRAIEAVLDGRQPIDVPGAVMVARHAIARATGGGK